MAYLCYIQGLLFEEKMYMHFKGEAKLNLWKTKL